MRIIRFLFSGTLMGILLVVFAIAIGYATFIENDFGIPSSKALVYNAWWFELVMLLLMVNFIGNIKKYELLQRKKLSVLMFHLSWELEIGDDGLVFISAGSIIGYGYHRHPGFILDLFCHGFRDK